MTDTTTLFYADGTEHQGAGKAGDRIIRKVTCPRCVGRGTYSIGICFCCNGRGTIGKTAVLYTAAQIEKRTQAQARAEEKKEQALKARRATLHAQAMAVPGIQMAMVKARIISSVGLRKDVRMTRWIEKDLNLVRDLVSKPSLTPNQAALLVTSVDRLSQHMAQAEQQADFDAALRADARNWIRSAKGTTIEGTVMTTREEATEFGWATKALMKDATGRRYWFSIPKNLLELVGHNHEVLRGRTIRVVGNVEPSQKDPIFGFISRPRKGELLPDPTV